MYLELVPGKLKMAHLNGIVWRSFQQSFDKHGWNYGNSLSVSLVLLLVGKHTRRKREEKREIRKRTFWVSFVLRERI